MTNYGPIIDRVENYFVNLDDVEIKWMTKISLMAYIVRDNYHETDVYFDAKSYKLKYEHKWIDDNGKNILFHKSLERFSLGVLMGIHCDPKVRDPIDAYNFANQQLESVSKINLFYANPFA